MMTLDELLLLSTRGADTVGDDWMSATAIRPLIFDDPAILWLERFGKAHGFEQDRPSYSFSEFLAKKGREFELAFLANIAGEAITVCNQAYEVRSSDKVRRTIEMMLAGKTVIYQPALWWAESKLYGVPDFLIRSTWLKQHYPELAGEVDADRVAPNLFSEEEPGHYIVLDVKFTTKLEDTRKRVDMSSYSGQVRIYSYMLGKLQGLMPNVGLIAARDHIYDPHPIIIESKTESELDPDLAEIQKTFLDIVTNGETYTPWQDEIVRVNLTSEDEKWHTAKKIIATERIEGKDPSLLYQIGQGAKQALADLGYANLASLLAGDPEDIPLEECRGIGAKKARQIRAIIKAQKSGGPYLPADFAAPQTRPKELFVDFEYFNNLNVDFEKEWPDLNGREMIFMIGFGWVERDSWRFKALVAGYETPVGEKELLDQFASALNNIIGGQIDRDTCAIYHWTSPEVWQLRKACERHSIDERSPLHSLPFVDLQKVLLEGPVGIPGALDFGLKEVAHAVGELDSQFKTEWPLELAEGLSAMVMGWRAYEDDQPLKTKEMELLRLYLESDCRSLWKVLGWLRSLSHS